MERMALAMKAAIVYGLALRLHHHFYGPPFDYSALAIGCMLSWAGLPGPGEPLLIAAGVLAAKHKLDLGEVLLVAFASATAGGIAGYVIGHQAGRGVLSAPGPLRGLRLGALAWGDQVFQRYAVIAILVAPSWVSGIHRVRPSLYNIVNVLSAAAWAVGIGVAAYFAGPPVIEWVQDIGWAAAAILVLLVCIVLWEVLRRRRRRRSPIG
jgi:membrane protein DedA with SNARE-associated domain